jgi:hypothetical protein
MAESKEKIVCSSCGVKYRWKAELAGKSVKCKCGQKIKVPAQALGIVQGPSAPPPLPVQGQQAPSSTPAKSIPAPGAIPAPPPPRRCPKCKEAVSGNAVLCVSCGMMLDGSSSASTSVTSPGSQSRVRRDSTSRSAARQSTGRRESAYDQLDSSESVSPPKKPLLKNRWVQVGLGGVGMLVLVILWNSFVVIDFVAPPGSGTQSRTVKSVDFYNFDEATDLDDVKISAPNRITSGNTYLEATGSFKLFSVNANAGQWVFVWQGTGMRNGLQGLPTTYGPGVPASGVKSPPRHFSDRSANGDKGRKQWTNVQNFVVQSSFLDVYVAVVDHPYDADSRERARLFVDDAITRSRTIHHGKGIMALMRSFEKIDNPAWTAWLEKVAAMSVEDLEKESDPKQDKLIQNFIQSRAIETHREVAATLAILSDFKNKKVAGEVFASPAGRAALERMLNEREVSNETIDRYVKLVKLQLKDVQKALLRPFTEWEQEQRYRVFLKDVTSRVSELGPNFYEQRRALQDFDRRKVKDKSDWYQEAVNAALAKLPELDSKNSHWPLLMWLASTRDPEVFISVLFDCTKSNQSDLSYRTIQAFRYMRRSSAATPDQHRDYAWALFDNATRGLRPSRYLPLNKIESKNTPHNYMAAALVKHKADIYQLYKNSTREGLWKVLGYQAMYLDPELYKALNNSRKK